MCEVNRERSCLAAASSVCDSTKQNGLVTLLVAFYGFYLKCWREKCNLLFNANQAEHFKFWFLNKSCFIIFIFQIYFYPTEILHPTTGMHRDSRVRRYYYCTWYYRWGRVLSPPCRSWCQEFWSSPWHRLPLRAGHEVPRERKTMRIKILDTSLHETSEYLPF